MTYSRLDTNPNPTEAELTAIIAYAEQGDGHLAAYSLDITFSTFRNQLTSLYKRINAKSATHAVLLLWPVIGEAIDVKHNEPIYGWPRVRPTKQDWRSRVVDRRSGRDRRAHPDDTPIARIQ